jgi:hypothetical protein
VLVQKSRWDPPFAVGLALLDQLPIGDVDLGREEHFEEFVAYGASLTSSGESAMKTPRGRVVARLYEPSPSRRIASAASWCGSTSSCRATEDKVSDLLGHVGLQPSGHLRVNVQDDTDVGVTEPLLDDLGMHTGGERKAAHIMPKIVQLDWGRPSLVDEPGREAFRMQRRAVDSAEDQIVITPASAEE